MDKKAYEVAFRMMAPPRSMPLSSRLALQLNVGVQIGFFVFAYAYAKGYEGGNRALEGLRFGVVVGLLLACFAVTWNYVVLPVSGSLGMAWIVDTLVEMAIYGVIVGLVYKPIAGRK